MTPEISVVIPTVNRRPALLRLLHALGSDAFAPPFEVVVVDDGSSDDTVATLHELRPPFPLHIVPQKAGGPSRARNAGARAAHAPVLLFLDDDVEPLPGTLAAHVACHSGAEPVIGVGDLPPVVTDSSFIGITLRGWWQRMLADVRHPGHRATFRNVLTGHLSIRRDLFVSLGGFDPELRCHEDWEFGYRAMQQGMRIQFVPGAVAYHYDTSNLAKILRRKFDEGVADIELAQRHPELAPVLPFYWPPPGLRTRLVKRVAWIPSLERLAASTLHARLQVFERLRMRGRWRASLDLLLTFWYWRGVASVLMKRERLHDFSVATDEPRAEAFIDLADGLRVAERRLDAVNPGSVAVFYRDALVAIIPDPPGAEPLRGEHLRPWLMTAYPRWRLRQVLLEAGMMPEVLQPAAGDSTDLSGKVTHVGAPVMRDKEVTTHSTPTVDMQHGATVPPVHHVA